MDLRPALVMPWHRPDPMKPPKAQIAAAFQETMLDHMANLNLDSPVAATNLTAIMCTLGPSTYDVEEIEKLLIAGMDIVKLEMAMLSIEEFAKIMINVRTAVNKYSIKIGRVYPLAVAVDLRGPEMRIGDMEKEEGVEIVPGPFTLTHNPLWAKKGNARRVYVDFDNLVHLVRIGDKIYLDQGRIELICKGTVDYDIECEVLRGGILKSRNYVSAPGVPLDIPPITERDKKDLIYIVDQGVDFVLVSFVRCASTIKDMHVLLKNMPGDCGKALKVFAKIETRLAMDNIDSIIDASDGILVARGDLGIELPTEQMFLAQKIVISKCNKKGKPVILGSQLLNSMKTGWTPSRAEVTDVANAVFDGADVLYLTSETSHGMYPCECVHMLVKICKSAEAAIWQTQLFNTLTSAAVPPIDPSHSVAIAAVEASLKCNAAAILVITSSGHSASLIAEYRPRCPIFAITRYGQVARQLNIYRGVLPIHYITPMLADWNRDVDVRLQMGIETGKINNLIKPGDALILVNGWRQGAGFTNIIRFVYASESNPWVYPHYTCV